MALGAHGGDHIPQGTLQLLLNVLEFGRDSQEAVEEPRFYSYNFPSSNWASRYDPGMLRLEGRISGEVVEGLRRKGHTIEQYPDWWGGFSPVLRHHPQPGYRRPPGRRGTRAAKPMPWASSLGAMAGNFAGEGSCPTYSATMTGGKAATS